MDGNYDSTLYTNGAFRNWGFHIYTLPAWKDWGLLGSNCRYKLSGLPRWGYWHWTTRPTYCFSLTDKQLLVFDLPLYHSTLYNLRYWPIRSFLYFLTNCLRISIFFLRESHLFRNYLFNGAVNIIRRGYWESRLRSRLVFGRYAVRTSDTLPSVKCESLSAVPTQVLCDFS
jgi:hypothetical protein